MMTRHFVERVKERIGDVDADTLAQGLIWAIQNERSDLAEFVGRINRNGSRVFKFRAANGKVFYALVNTETWVCITVMPEGFTINRQGKSPIRTYRNLEAAR